MRSTNNRLTRSQRRGSQYFVFYRTRTRFHILDHEHEYRFAEYRLAEYRFAEYRFAEYRFAEYREIRCEA
jgi:hypothetical protein